MMRRRVRFAAVLVVVVLALTGFSTSSSGGKGRSGKSGSSGDGGGCSSSKKSNNGYHSSDDDYDDGSSSSGSSGGSTYATPTATASSAADVRVVRCAQPRKGKRKAVTSSTIEVRPTTTGAHTYDIDVIFLDARGDTVSTGETTVDGEPGDVRTVTVRMDSPGKVSRVKACQVTAVLRR